MKFRQGKAPTILYRDGARVWEFRGGRFETEDSALAALLVERGAVAEGSPSPADAGQPPLGGGLLETAEATPRDEAEQAPLKEGGGRAAAGGSLTTGRKRTKAAP